MDVYAFALALGAAGLAAMTLLGFHHGHAPGSGGHAHGHHTGHGSTHAHAGGHQSHARHQHDADSGSHWLVFLSPRLWFSLLVGFGATGLLLQEHVTGLVKIGVAVLGGLVFEGLLM